MERDAGSVRLTAKGHELLGYARNVLSSVDEFVEAANGETAFDGAVRLGVNEMAERNIDLAFQSGPFARKASGEHCLGVYPIVWVASPATGLSSDHAVSVEDLSKFPILTHARRTRPYEDVAAHFAQWPKLKTRLVPSSNLSACLQMAVDGYGVAALLAPMVEQELASGQLIELNYVWTPEPLSFAARFDKSRSSSVVQSAADIAHDCAKKYYDSFQSTFKHHSDKRVTNKKAS